MFKEKSEQIFLYRCTGHHSCSFFASDFEFGPNNCNPQGTDRYLEAHFVCHPPEDGVNTNATGSRKTPPPWPRNGEEETNYKRRIPVKPPEEKDGDDRQPKNSRGSSINTNRNDDDKSKKSRRVPITAPPTLSATTTSTTVAPTTMKYTSAISVFSTTTSLREISAAPVYENSNDDEGSIQLKLMSKRNVF